MILLSVYCLAEEVSGATAQTGGSETISLVGFPPWLVWPLAILGGLAILAYLIKQIRGWVPPGGLLDCRPPRGETRPDARQSADMQEIQSRLNAVNSRVDDLDKKVNETSVKVVVSELKQYMKEGLASLIAQQV
ncbi:MAG: hypothetical protein NT049_11990, partial [Planctomycetota bacterium]|nr:hypothetical protein [Planctomycetota bacterium]